MCQYRSRYCKVAIAAEASLKTKAPSSTAPFLLHTILSAENTTKFMYRLAEIKSLTRYLLLAILSTDLGVLLKDNPLWLCGRTVKIRRRRAAVTGMLTAYVPTGLDSLGRAHWRAARKPEDEPECVPAWILANQDRGRNGTMNAKSVS